MKVISDKTGITVVSDEGDLYVVSASDIAYSGVKEYVTSGGRDIEKLHELFVGSKKEAVELSNEAVSIVDDGDPAYRVANNDPVSDIVLETAIRVRRNGHGGSKAIKAFLKRLKKNPSAESRSQLFAWLKAEGFTLTSKGLIVGYKGVTTNFESISVGNEPVTVTVKGVSTVHTGKIPYLVGSEVSIPRDLVDANRDESCSVGLHVGTHAYASGFGHRVILVLVDPADVVSVPRDHSGQKMRVCRLVVAAEHDGDKITDAVMTIPDPVARKRYRERKGNRPAVTAHVVDDASDPHDDDGNRLTPALPDVEDVVKDVASAIASKLSESPYKSRDLGKRLSKNRRAHLAIALEYLVNNGTAVRDDNGFYSLTADKDQ